MDFKQQKQILHQGDEILYSDNFETYKDFEIEAEVTYRKRSYFIYFEGCFIWSGQNFNAMQRRIDKLCQNYNMKIKEQ